MGSNPGYLLKSPLLYLSYSVATLVLNKQYALNAVKCTPNCFLKVTFLSLFF